MKTAIAAFMHASLEFLSSCKNKFNGSLSFLLTADEEVRQTLEQKVW